MILEAPTDLGRDYFSREVMFCADDTKLRELARYYIDRFVRSFKSAKDHTPASWLHSSRPSFDDTQETLKYLLEAAPRNHQTAKEKALIRDGYRCTLTGSYDSGCYREVTTVMHAVNNGSSMTITNAAHILPESTNVRISGENAEAVNHEYAASIWAVLDHFGQVFVPDELNGPDIHRLENVITMDTVKHNWFDRLFIWFEETATPNQYTLNAVAPPYIAGLPASVTLATTDAALPLPSPRYLRLHAACARVAHLSGAG